MVQNNNTFPSGFLARAKRVDCDYMHQSCLVNISRQLLSLTINGVSRFTCPASSAARGIGNRDGSLQTPTGMHCIAEKIGHDVPCGAIFESRIWNGEICPPGDKGENRILTRILRLRGLEPGVNQGDGIDTWERYIYIHGTNREDLVGSPFTHGCIVLRNEDIITLYHLVDEGCCVYIDSW